MAIFYQTNELPAFKNPIITIGTFDGVHEGHRVILEEVLRYAKEANGESVLITFEPHPRKVLFPDQPLQLLTSLSQKISLIDKIGIDHVIVAPFTKEFAGISAIDYLKEFLVKQFHPSAIVIGYDHRFGHDRKGDLSMLRQFSEECNFAVHEIPEQLIDDAGVSSTKIRKALLAGDVVGASHMLGRNYSFCGNVIKGAQLGRTIGFPTANIKPDDAHQLIPAKGVYAIQARVNNEWINGMMNIGIRPTVSNELTLHIEAHLFDFAADLYDRNLEVSFIARLRDEQKFASLDALKTQLGLDKTNARNVLAKSKHEQK